MKKSWTPDESPKIIGLVGAPSTGKTTLSRAISTMLSRHELRTEIVPEYAREYKIMNGKITNPFEQLAILHEQLRLERMAYVGTRCDFIILDSPTWVGYVYANIIGENHGCDYDRIRLVLNQISDRCDMEGMHCHLTLYCETDRAFFRDGVRDDDEARRQLIADRLQAYMKMEGIDYVTVEGNTDQRIAIAETVIKEQFSQAFAKEA